MIQNRWFMLALLFLARTVMGLQFQSVGSVGPILVEALSIDYTAIGTLIGLYFCRAFSFFCRVACSVSASARNAWWSRASRLWGVGGALMGMSTSFTALACGRVLSDTGAVLMNVLLTKMVADWFAGREIATAMAILVTSWPVGIALGLLGFAPLANWLGWQAVMHVAAYASVPCLIPVALVYRNPHGAGAAHSKFELKLSAGEWTLVSIAGLVWATYNVGYILLVSFLPAHLAGHGFRSDAGLCAGGFGSAGAW